MGIFFCKARKKFGPILVTGISYNLRVGVSLKYVKRRTHMANTDREAMTW